MIGILCMRGIAEVIIQLMKKIPELEVMAYALIALIAIKLFISIRRSILKFQQRFLE